MHAIDCRAYDKQRVAFATQTSSVGIPRAKRCNCYVVVRQHTNSFVCAIRGAPFEQREELEGSLHDMGPESSEMKVTQQRRKLLLKAES